MLSWVLSEQVVLKVTKSKYHQSTALALKATRSTDLGLKAIRSMSHPAMKALPIGSRAVKDLLSIPDSNQR